MPLQIQPHDPARSLKTAEAVEEYLIAAFETEDPAFIMDALGVVARARGMSELAKESGLTRATLYKALSATGNPEFATVVRVARALGFRLMAQRATA